MLYPVFFEISGEYGFTWLLVIFAVVYVQKWLVDVLKLVHLEHVMSKGLQPAAPGQNFLKSFVHSSGQIIATSHDLTPNCGLVREITLFQIYLGW